ncbi:hypothetical protein FB446DRAFT_40102 [Lentinula raphanica]|nr:hypothetical protein FB446DRAFT_40102 [Lentinula raphanica]
MVVKSLSCSSCLHSDSDGLKLWSLVSFTATAGSMTWALVALLQRSNLCPTSFRNCAVLLLHSSWYGAGIGFYRYALKRFRLQDHDIPIPYLSFSRRVL